MVPEYLEGREEMSAEVWEMWFVRRAARSLRRRDSGEEEERSGMWSKGVAGSSSE